AGPERHCVLADLRVASSNAIYRRRAVAQLVPETGFSSRLAFWSRSDGFDQPQRLSQVGPHSDCPKSQAPATKNPAPAIPETARPAGIPSPASTRIAIAATHNTSITPPTKSSAINAQQQPMQ